MADQVQVKIKEKSKTKGNKETDLVAKLLRLILICHAYNKKNCHTSNKKSYRQ